MKINILSLFFSPRPLCALGFEFFANIGRIRNLDLDLEIRSDLVDCATQHTTRRPN